MKTLRVQKAFDPARLHTELQSAGVPVLTIRASHPDTPGPAFYGVAVLEDKADLKNAQSVIQAHQEPRKPSRQPDPAVMETALREMEKV